MDTHDDPAATYLSRRQRAPVYSDILHDVWGISPGVFLLVKLIEGGHVKNGVYGQNAR